MKKYGYLITAAAIALSVCFATSNRSVFAEESDDADATIAENISIAGVDASGMNAEEAQEILDDLLATYEDVSFTFTVEDASVTADAETIGLSVKNDDVIERALNYGNEGNPLTRYMANADMEHGASKNFDVTLTAETSTLRDYFTIHTSDLVDEAVDNTVVHEDGAFVYVEGKSGTALLIDKSITKVSNFLASDWDGADASIELLTEEDEPQGTEEELATIQDLLGTYNTDFGTSTDGRTKNIAVGASHVNGTVVYPGGTISVSDTIGPTTEENGFYLAGAYENGETVESYGGGICQVSTTLYNAVLRAELEIVTRSAHSMIVAYVEPSMDAAIADGLKDFQFKNNLDTPVYIEMYTSGSKLYASVYGQETRDAGHSVDFVSEVTSQTDPETEFVEDPTQPIGYYEITTKPHTGYTARLWKITYQDGVETERKVINNSTYQPSKQVITVGTASSNAEGTAAVQAALAAANESQAAEALIETINTWNDEAIAARAAAEAAAEAAAAAAAESSTTDTTTSGSGTTDTTTSGSGTTDSTSSSSGDSSSATTN